MKLTLPKIATWISGIIAIATFITQNSSVIITIIPNNQDRYTFIHVVLFVSIIITMFGHSIGASNTQIAAADAVKE